MSELPDERIVYERSYLAGAAEDLPWMVKHWSGEKLAEWFTSLSRHAERLADAEREQAK